MRAITEQRLLTPRNCRPFPESRLFLNPVYGSLKFTVI